MTRGAQPSSERGGGRRRRGEFRVNFRELDRFLSAKGFYTEQQKAEALGITRLWLRQLRTGAQPGADVIAAVIVLMSGIQHVDPFWSFFEVVQIDEETGAHAPLAVVPEEPGPDGDEVSA